MHRRHSRYITQDTTSTYSTQSTCSFGDLESLASLDHNTLTRICGIKNIDLCRSKRRKETECVKTRSSSECKRRKYRSSEDCKYKQRYLSNKKCKRASFCQACGVAVDKNCLTCDTCSTYDGDSIHREVRDVLRNIDDMKYIGTDHKKNYIKKCKRKSRCKSKHKSMSKCKKKNVRVSKRGRKTKTGKSRKTLTTFIINPIDRVVKSVLLNRAYRIAIIRFILFYLFLRIIGLT